MKHKGWHLVASAVFAALLWGGSPASAQTLGDAQSFAVLGGTAVTANGSITGDVGVSPGTSITGSYTVAPGFGTHANDGAAQAAQSSVASLYATLLGTGGATGISAELGDVQITPGTYSFSSTANIAANKTLTLSGGGTYIFKVGSAITANIGSSVTLINGASACNVFWQVTSDATLNGVTFAGTVVAHDSVTLGVGAALSGRALTTAVGAVTLSGGNTIGGCSGPGGGCQTITLAPATLPSGTLGIAYSRTITGSGGATPYTFGVTSGALPPGLTLTPAGVLGGTPTTAATFSFTVRGTDANGCFASVAYTIVIASPCPTITLAPATLPNGTAAVAYSQTILGSGGTAPYSFGVTVGALPAGLSLTSAGVLVGTPSTAATSSFTIRGTDSAACFGSVAYALVIAAAPPPPPVCPTITLAPATLLNGTVGVAYTQTITGGGGTAPYSFGVTVGALPGGLTLTGAGVLAGTPTTGGTSNFTVRGTDAAGCFKDVAATLVIAAAPPPPPVCPTITLAPATLLNGTVGVAYTQTIAGSGGTAPYSFGVTAGALPGGLTLTGAGVLAGTPTTVGISAFRVEARSANGCAVSVAYTISIAALPTPGAVCPPIALAPATLPGYGTEGLPFSVTFTGSGGAAPYVFGVTAGALPTGTTLTSAGVLAGTPTVAGTYAFTLRATDRNGCFKEMPYTGEVIAAAAVPTLSQGLTLFLAAGLVGMGWLRLRRTHPTI